MSLRNIGCNFEVVGISEVDRYALLSYDSIHNNNETVEEKNKEDMLNEMKVKNIGYNFSTGKSEIPKNEKDIKKLYEAHIRSKNFGDIRLINPNELPEFDLFTYSFPCKNISVAGKQGGAIEGSGTQSSLIWDCKGIIKVKKPKYLMMENVKNLVSKSHIHTLNMWCEELEKLGYKNYLPENGYLNGKEFNVPQHRERVILISIRNDVEEKFSFPVGKGCNISVRDILETENIPSNLLIPNEQLIPTTLVDSKEYLSITKDSKLIYVSSLNIKGNESMKRVYLDKGLCPTLNSMNGGNRQPKIMICNNDNEGYTLRKLTPLECWRVMGFSDEDFIKAKNAGLPNSKLYERAGRGIVVPMLEEIFKNLLGEYIEKNNQ